MKAPSFIVLIRKLHSGFKRLTKPFNTNKFFLGLVILFMLMHLPKLSSEPNPPDIEAVNEASYIGMTLDDLINRFGVPESIYPVRGLEDWQDDVVFVYAEGDFYIYRNRVWQIGISSYMGVNTGDLGREAMDVLDQIINYKLNSPENYIAYFLHEWGSPMILRVDMDDAGRVRGIFIFRSDL